MESLLLCLRFYHCYYCDDDYTAKTPTATTASTDAAAAVCDSPTCSASYGTRNKSNADGSGLGATAVAQVIGHDACEDHDGLMPFNLLVYFSNSNNDNVGIVSNPSRN